MIILCFQVPPLIGLLLLVASRTTHGATLLHKGGRMTNLRRQQHTQPGVNYTVGSLPPAPTRAPKAEYEGGLSCVAWRKTLNCDPSGPRDNANDKGCDVVISGMESGFCECANYVQTGAVICGHAPINCATECSKKVDVKEAVVFTPMIPNGIPSAGNGPPLFHGSMDPFGAAQVHMNQAMADVAGAGAAALDGVRASQAMMMRMNNLKPWHEVQKAADSIYSAGVTMKAMADKTLPLVSSS